MEMVSYGAVAVNCAADKTVECGSTWDFDGPSGTSTCAEPAVTITLVGTTTNYSGCGETFTATRTWNLTDNCSETATCSQTVTVLDRTAPDVDYVPVMTVEMGTAWNFTEPLVSDECVFFSAVYDDSVNDLTKRFDPGTIEVGDEIILAGTARYLSSFAFEYWGTAAGAAFQGQVTARLRFYANDGPTVSGYPTPGTVLYDSGNFRIAPTVRSVLTFNDLTAAQLPLTGPVPNSFTWSVQFSGMEGADRAGLDVFSPPVVGNGYTDYWEATTGGWDLKRSDTEGENIDFAAIAYAGHSATRLSVAVVSTVTNYTGCGETYVATRSWQATDPCGNSTNFSQVVTAQDTAGPVLTIPPNMTVECGTPWDFGAPTASDTCVFDSLVYDDSQMDLVTRFDPGLNEVGDEVLLAGDARNLTRFTLEYWGIGASATAFEGNVTGRLRFYRNDGEAYNGYPTPGTLLYDSGAFAVNPTVRSTLTFDDFVTGAALPLSGPVPDTFTWSIQFSGMSGNDRAGIDLFSPPAVGGDFPDYWDRAQSGWELKEGAVPMDFAALAYASHSTNRLVIVVVSTVTNTTCIDQTYTATRTWRATDPCGNRSTPASQTVTIVDTTAPVITTPAPIVAHTGVGVCSAVVNYTATAADACLSATAPVCTPASGSTFPLGITEVSCTSTDACGNVASASFTVTVEDHQGPTMICGNITTNTTGGCEQVVPLPRGSDFCGGEVLVVCTPAGPSFPVGATDVNCTATDARGNSTSCSFTITVNDAEFPAIVCSPAIVTNTTTTCGQVVNFAVTSSDNCSATVVCTPASGSSFPLGTTTVNCVATDASDNTSSCSFPVTVNDTTPPVVACPANISVNVASGCAQTVSFTFSPTDNCSVANSSCEPASGSSFPVGTTTVNCSASDPSGNSSACSFTVTVRDTIAPVLSVVNVITNLTAGCSQIVEFAPTVTDNCTVESITCTPASGSAFAVGTNSVTCIAADPSGNKSTNSFKVVVTDTLPPLLECQNIVTNITSGCSQVVNYAPAATDNCTLTNVSCTPASGTTFNLGTANVTCTARDRYGNSASCTFSVTVEDVELPVLTGCPADIVTNSGPRTCAQPVTYTLPTATDNCGVTSLICRPPSGSAFPVGANVVTCAALDTSANSNSCSFVITVLDFVVPKIGHPNIVTNAITGCQQMVNYAPTNWDNCGGLSIVCEPPSGSAFPVGPSSVTCVATDRGTNTASCTFTVTVLDAIQPTLACPGNMVTNTTGQCTQRVTFNPAASDNCNPVNVVCTPPSGSDFPVGFTTVSCTATDPSGNSRTCTFRVLVVDLQNPVVACAGNISNVPSDPDKCGAVVVWGDPLVFDNCPTTITCVPPSGSVFAVGTRTVRCTATDPTGLTGTCSFTVSVRDATPPFICDNPAVVYAVGGTNDNYSGIEPASPSINQYTRLDGVDYMDFDDPSMDSWFAHSFENLPAHIAQAKLRIKMHAGAGSENDTIMLACTTSGGSLGTNYWSRRIGTNPADGIPGLRTTPWSQGLQQEVVLNLADLANTNGPGSDMVPLLNQTGYLDIYIQNDTGIDYMVLEIKTCVAQNELIIEKECNGDGAIVNYDTPAFTDLCGATPTVVCNPPSGSLFPVGTTLVDCLATDANNNRGHASFSVTVTGTPIPAVNLTVRRQGDQVLVTWPTSCASYVLEQATTLGVPGQWEAVTGQVQTLGGINQWVCPPSGTARYFRLRKL